MEILVVENEYKIVLPLFCEAYALPIKEQQFYTHLGLN